MHAVVQEPGDHDQAGRHVDPPAAARALPDYAGVASPITNNQWQHIAITWSFASRRAQLWRNGVLLSPLDHALSPTWDRAGVPCSWTWGNDPDRLLRHFTGTLDELRLESIERSPEWIATTYANRSAPDAFLTLGAEVVQR